jgi:hypothetical protein
MAMATRKRQLITVRLEKCKPDICESNCYLMENRHYPFRGTSELIAEPKYEIKIARINIMFGPENRVHQWANLEAIDTPKGYKLWTNIQEGAEMWERYHWWTGRIPLLVPGDILQENYYATPSLRPADLMTISRQSNNFFKGRRVIRNFLVREDSGDTLSLIHIQKIPDDPIALLRT